MQLIEPSRYRGAPASKILLLGPSESREAFWPEPFRERLGARLVNDSLSMSDLDDAVTQLEYLQRSYGPDAIGRWLILAVSPRFLLGHTPGRRPLPILLDRYSPELALDESTSPQRLVAKSWLAGRLAQLRLLAHSRPRYRAALRALRAQLEVRARGGTIDEQLRRHFLVGSRFFHRAPHDKQAYYDRAMAGRGPYPAMRTLDPRPRRQAVLRAFDRLRALAARSHTRIVVVNMPEGGWARSGYYAPGIAEAHLALLCEATAGLPLIDLRSHLRDDEFFDWAHPSLGASIGLSRFIADAIARLDAGQGLARAAGCSAGAE